MLRTVAGDMACAVATGSTSWAFTPANRIALALCPAVLVAFDAEDAGERAAARWMDALPNAVRLRPGGGKDPGEMHAAGLDVRAWVREGVRLASAAGAAVTVPPAPDPAGGDAGGTAGAAPGDGAGDGPPPALALPAEARADAAPGADASGADGDEASPTAVTTPEAEAPKGCPEAARLRRVRVPRVAGVPVTLDTLDRYRAAWRAEGVDWTPPRDVARALAARAAGVI
jgi:hypothetical protein